MLSGWNYIVSGINALDEEKMTDKGGSDINRTNINLNALLVKLKTFSSRNLVKKYDIITCEK